jgi:hypothetical protein
MSAGLLDSPEILSVTAYGATNGCTYNAYADLAVLNEEPKVFTAVYVFADAAGRVHRSAPSVPLYVGMLQANRTTTTRVVLIVTCPIFLQRSKGTAYLEIYSNFPGDTPQLCGVDPLDLSTLDGSDYVSIAVGNSLNPTAGVGTQIDTEDYRSSKTLYTEGDVLAADPWPNFSFVVESGKRLFARSIGDPNTLYYSKIYEQNVAPEFNAALTITLANNEITAMGVVDDKVIVFTKKDVWVVDGTGPDNTGANGDFFLQRLPFAVGCDEQRSIISYADGVAFFSNTTKGFHVITRDLQIADIGSPISDISGRVNDVVSGIVVPYDTELRWYVTIDSTTEFLAAGALTSPVQPPRPKIANVPTTTSCILVYDYGYQKWIVRSMASAVSNFVMPGGTVLVNDKVGIVSPTYNFHLESDNHWSNSELMKWETPWIKVNQLQDFGRFYEATFLGKYLSSWNDPIINDNYEAGDLQIVVTYDYEGASADSDTFRFRANQDFNPSNGDRLQFRVRPRRQKCQAIKFTITEIPTEKIEVWEPTYTTGRGFVLTAADIYYGAKGGSGSKSLGSNRRKG